MKTIIQRLYTKNTKLAIQVAKVLGYKIKAAVPDEVGKFWVVTRATKESTLDDILFEMDVFGMMLQAKGGLDKNDILGIFKDKKKATTLASKELAKV